MTRSGTERRRPLLLALGFEGAVGVAALVAALLFGIRLGPLFHLTLPDLAAAAAGVLLLAVVFVIVALSAWPPFERIRRQLDQVLPQLFDGAPITALLAVSAVAGVSEELLFRAVLQNGLAGIMSTWAAVLIANLIFAALHLITPTYGVIAFFMGIILSAVFIVTGSLVAAAVTHGVYDFIALVLYLRRRYGRNIETSGSGTTATHPGNGAPITADRPRDAE
jgi:hypothetical protein